MVRKSKLRERKVELVYCAKTTLDRKGTGYNVIDMEYTRMGFYKEFDSKEAYETYTRQRIDLDKRVDAIDEHNEWRELLGRKPCEKEELIWLRDAKKFLNTWGESYVPENIRSAMDGVLLRKDEEYLEWTPFVKALKKQVEVTETIDYYNMNNRKWDSNSRLDDDECCSTDRKRMKNVVMHETSGGDGRKRLLLGGYSWIEAPDTPINVKTGKIGAYGINENAPNECGWEEKPNRR